MKIHKDEILKGLKSPRKYISSRFFYDEIGDKIFQEIMNMPEYYIPDAEREIIKNQSSKIVNFLKSKNNSLNIIELGCGDGTKTVHFLEAFQENIKIKYTPLDISANALQVNHHNIRMHLPELKIEAKPGNYFETLSDVASAAEDKLYLFLGATIGNYNFEEAIEFTKWLSEMMFKNDHLIIAFDLKKEPRKIIKAYDDPHKITKRFNLNLLDRLNRELDANFDKSKFRHFPAYDPVTGETKSYLISDVDQVVHIAGEEVHFKTFEPIYTEISLKYSLDKIEDLAERSKLKIEKTFINQKHRYAWTMFRK